MRLDRIYSEGEATGFLRRLGFDVQPAPNRPSLYTVSHPAIGGTRVFTVQQLCSFAEGGAVLEDYLRTHATSGARG